MQSGHPIYSVRGNIEIKDHRFTGDTWKSVLELDGDRRVTSGNSSALCDAIRRGADLRILTEFVYNEHIDVHSENAELVREVSDFRVT